MSQLDILTFGQARVAFAGQDVAWPAASARDLLLYLLSSPSGRSRADIVTALWPDEQLDRAAAGNRFRVALHRLRVALRDAGAVTEELERYRLSSAVIQASDAWKLGQALRDAEVAQTPAERRTALLTAVGLYSGEYLPDHRSDWAAEVRAAHKASYVQASLELSMLHCAAAECAPAIRQLAGALRADPLIGENYHQDLMACLASVQGKYAAVEHYRRFLELLRLDLGETPMQETNELAARLKAGDDVCPHQIGRDLPCGRHLARQIGALELREDAGDLHQELLRARTVLHLSNSLQAATTWAEVAEQSRRVLSGPLRLDSLQLLQAGERPDEPAGTAEQTVPVLNAVGHVSALLKVSRPGSCGPWTEHEQKLLAQAACTLGFALRKTEPVSGAPQEPEIDLRPVPN
jgi:DNA-binding SARP family transcriptional activator